jgi:hypothetical protein
MVNIGRNISFARKVAVASAANRPLDRAVFQHPLSPFLLCSQITAGVDAPVNQWPEKKEKPAHLRLQMHRLSGLAVTFAQSRST